MNDDGSTEGAPEHRSHGLQHIINDIDPVVAFAESRCSMLSRETLEVYRRMTPGERLKLACEMSDQAALDLLRGPTEMVARRFELLQRQNDDRNRRMLEGIARTKRL